MTRILSDTHRYGRRQEIGAPPLFETQTTPVSTWVEAQGARMGVNVLIREEGYEKAFPSGRRSSEIAPAQEFGHCTVQLIDKRQV